MKKIILTTLVALMMASSSFAGVVITVKISIGKKSIPGCPNFGLCDLSISASYQDGLVNGTLAVDQLKQSMILGINEKDILKVQPDKIIYFKGKGSVIFTEDYILPSEFNTAAKVKAPLVIKKGEYPVTYLKGIYYIEFPL